MIDGGGPPGRILLPAHDLGRALRRAPAHLADADRMGEHDLRLALLARREIEEPHLRHVDDDALARRVRQDELRGQRRSPCPRPAATDRRPDWRARFPRSPTLKRRAMSVSVSSLPTTVTCTTPTTSWSVLEREASASARAADPPGTTARRRRLAGVGFRHPSPISEQEASAAQANAAATRRSRRARRCCSWRIDYDTATVGRCAAPDVYATAAPADSAARCVRSARSGKWRASSAPTSCDARDGAFAVAAGAIVRLRSRGRPAPTPAATRARRCRGRRRFPRRDRRAARR